MGAPAHRLHGSAAARAGQGVLLLGPPGAGKSDLLLRLLPLGFDLVADDQVVVTDGVAAPPPPLAGLLEVRGLGLIRLAFVSARLVLVVALEAGERLPAPRRYDDLDLPLISVDARAASAPQRVALALDCLQGKIPLVAGALS
jgi:HPr kinase/phosphorylase